MCFHLSVHKEENNYYSNVFVYVSVHVKMVGWLTALKSAAKVGKKTFYFFYAFFSLCHIIV